MSDPSRSAASDAERLWAAHMDAEFVTKDVDATMATMVAAPTVNHVPVMTGGTGWDDVRAFYGTHFIPRMPPDVETTLVARTIGEHQLVDELVFRCTHSIEMDWLLPGVPPTGRRIEVPMVVVVGFRDGKVSHERIYWDQASVLVQVGLLDPARLPVAGVEATAKVLDPSLPSNTLIGRSRARAPRDGPLMCANCGKEFESQDDALWLGDERPVHAYCDAPKE